MTTDVLLRWLAACRAAQLPGRPGPNVVSLRGERLDRYAVTTINRRLAAVSGLFAFRAMRDPNAPNPVPRGREARWAAGGERNGLLAHLVRRPKPRSALRLREPRRLPRALDRAETTALLASLRTFRDRGIAGLMLLCGLRSGGVLDLEVGRCRHRCPVVAGDGQGGQGAPSSPRCRCGRTDPDLPARRAARHRKPKAVRGRQRPHPWPAPKTGPGCGQSSATTVPEPGCRADIRMLSGTPSAPPLPRPGWTWP